MPASKKTLTSSIAKTQLEYEKQRAQYKALLLEQRRIHEKRLVINRFSWIGAILNIILALIISSALASNIIDKGISKQEIHSKLLLPIQNGATTITLKGILESTLVYKSNFFKSKDNLYLENKPPTLEIVIQEMIMENFSKKDFDPKLNKKLNTLLLEFKQKDPFDKLPIKQRDLFENVRIKTKDYSVIQTDMVKIADELDISNQLVNEYLNDGKKSFWLSALGLALAVIIGIIQTYLAIDSRKSSARQYGNIITNLMRSKR
ncbi:hypothetical protein LEP1GSC202_0309 [Leptospira yanagawae serovar Saopaulo str. Sao Paulo = ATCC 700523]|uniref:Uncharacterized protein n=1 Tax=Leptospira yanagawae serovar Saopaulo str. Sao Paulo = ATCC 700523 TaxID=1249483 RepID=A0A5E8HLS7_9LEPT|nr:hypothetical protein [Leptospira yanagawae]EOQ90766.1 hypothetical protein LEP1GSC202_0309 [Leptospira yanagawae serovar Saopaulo str. Sao Paulo = ATCC 700523]